MIEWEDGAPVWRRDRAVWKQLTDELRERIQRGQYQPGYPIPSLNQLEQEFHVAKNTLRKVIAQLKDEGLIRAEWGVGTFVVPVEERERKTD